MSQRLEYRICLRVPGLVHRSNRVWVWLRRRGFVHAVWVPVTDRSVRRSERTAR